MSKPPPRRNKAKRVRVDTGLRIGQPQADRLLHVLARIHQTFDGWLPECAKEVRSVYAELAEQYANAGYDLPEKKNENP